MPLPSSGSMSMGANVNVELGNPSTTQIALGQASVRTLYGVASGEIRLAADGYGKSSAFAFTISSNTTDANLRTLAIAAGWNQSSPVTATVASNVYVYSTSVNNAGLTINGSWPGGVALINNGFIIGKGGDGAYLTNPGNSSYSYGSHIAAQSGSAAISLGVNATITNNSYIAGGGGGGAVGSSTNQTSFGGGGGGAGGGGGGGAFIGYFTNVGSSWSDAAGGAGGGPGQAGTNGSTSETSGTTGSFGDSYTLRAAGGGGGGRILPGSGGAGSTGNQVKGGSGGGSGGGGGTGSSAYYDYFGYGSEGWAYGGNGGSANNAGSNGSGDEGRGGGGGGGGWGAAGGSTNQVVGSAGAGGRAVELNGFAVTWVTNGTRYGAIS